MEDALSISQVNRMSKIDVYEEFLFFPFADLGKGASFFW